jgi:hypothetical protein
MAGRCAAGSPPLSLDGPSFNGWGGNLENWRFQPAPGLTAAHLLGDSGHLGRLIELLSGARGSTLPQPHP